MRRLASFALLSLTVVACCGPRPAPAAAPMTTAASCQVGDLLAKTVALVTPKDDGSMRAYCSGVWVGKRTILTAAHCVADIEGGEAVLYATRDDVYDGDAERPFVPRMAAVLAVDAGHDLATVLVASAPVHPVALVGTERLEAGQHVDAVGHSLGLWWSFSSGQIAATRIGGLDRWDEALHWTQATVPISPGNSGGGLWDEDGHLIGITSASFTRGQNLNIFIGPQHLAAMVKGAV